jgi:hypothetical protein
VAVLILILFPILYLFNSYLAMAALVAAIVAMYFERSRPPKRRAPKRPQESQYKAGYED